MKLVKLSRKEFRGRYGKLTGAHTHRPRGKEPTVFIPGRASTKEKLHEIYHATESPSLLEIEQGKRWYSPHELALEELRAEDFAFKRIGKEGVSWNSILAVGGHMLEEGYKPAVVMGAITEALDRLDYNPLSREERSYLWWMFKEYKRGM